LALARYIHQNPVKAWMVERGDNIYPHYLLRGHTDTIVLAMLMHADRYGLEIYNRILARTGEQYELKVDTLYSSYKRLEKGGYITSYWGDETQGERRKYYRITDKGANCIAKTC